ncbi:MAG: DUF2807 domain-containing protein, partial [Flavobacteriaceae bacterium]|nr:DUF2807 domain-containing protein [Flavobacteriaceae bacterium]
WDCLQVTGDIIQQEVDVAPFSKIVIEDDFELIIRQGASQQVIVETGANLFSDIEVTVEDGVIRFKNYNACNLVREYNVTKAIVTTDTLTEIRNSSAFNVVSEGVLSFPSLSLVSNTTAGVIDPRKSGDFTLEVDCVNLFVAANGQSGFYISGYTENASIGFEDEAPRFEGANLIIDDLFLVQRSANVMIVNPQDRIRGRIFGVGDVISLNEPPIVSVEEFFTGRLIFQD